MHTRSLLPHPPPHTHTLQFCDIYIDILTYVCMFNTTLSLSLSLHPIHYSIVLSSRQSDICDVIHCIISIHKGTGRYVSLSHSLSLSLSLSLPLLPSSTPTHTHLSNNKSILKIMSYLFHFLSLSPFPPPPLSLFTPHTTVFCVIFSIAGHM